jgi:NAD(P)H-dependent FMN reductase
MLTIISGTNRPGSYTRKVAAHLETVYRHLGRPTALIDLADLPHELFLPASYEEKPASFASFEARVLEATGLVVVTPEYNGGFPGVLKYFIDMLPFPEALQRRPAGFVGLGAGEWGALRPVEQLQAVFGYRHAFLYPERVFLRNCEDLFDESGALVSADIDRRLRVQARGFVHFVDSVRGLRQDSPA